MAAAEAGADDVLDHRYGVTGDKVAMEPTLDEAIADLFTRQKLLQVFGQTPQ